MKPKTLWMVGTLVSFAGFVLWFRNDPPVTEDLDQIQKVVAILEDQPESAVKVSRRTNWESKASYTHHATVSESVYRLSYAKGGQFLYLRRVAPLPAGKSSRGSKELAARLAGYISELTGASFHPQLLSTAVA